MRRAADLNVIGRPVVLLAHDLDGLPEVDPACTSGMRSDVSCIKQSRERVAREI
jgi:hypothetical protein